MKVVVPVQDDKCVNVLGGFIRNYPWPSDVQFRVMHVVHPVLVNSYMSLLPSALTETIAEDRRRQGEVFVKRLSETIHEALPSAEVDQNLLEGDARMEIVEQLNDWDADLVLLGSHGKGLMGSVSRAVVSHSPCSAMVVPIEHRDRKKTKEKMHFIV